MRIVSQQAAIQNMSSTRTIDEFGKLLGHQPHRLGQVVNMFQQHTISMLTEGLRNIYTQGKAKGKGPFKGVNSMSIEWSVQVNYIKKIYFVESCTTTGLNFSEVVMVFDQQYFDPFDVIILENRQQIRITGKARRLGTSRWEYRGVLHDNDPNKSLDLSYMKQGRYARYVTNYQPELSERGYMKYISNMEIHRNYISRHRSTATWSSDYATREDIYIETASGKGSGSGSGYQYYKLNPVEKECLDHFLMSRENALLVGRSNFDANGKCMAKDERGFDIPAGDGVLAQIERVANKFSYSVFTSGHLDDMIAQMASKSERNTGNHWTFIVNNFLWRSVQNVLKQDLRFQSPNDGSYYYSMEAPKGENRGGGQYVKVGATFQTYEAAGNKISFIVDRILDVEFPDRGYGVMIDTGATTSGQANLQMFTIEGCELLTGNLIGMGGLDGRSSGTISTPLAGSEYHLMGFSGVVLLNPYASFIVEEAVSF